MQELSESIHNLQISRQNKMANGLCEECKTHAGTEIFSEGTIAYIHGFSTVICKCCLLKKWRETVKNLEEGIDKLEAQITVTPCR
jgi:hypothetical protein